MERYDMVVIGAGAAGLTAAGGAAALGARVALLERDRMGGDCLNYGCVPSKALLHVANAAGRVRTRPNLDTVMDYVRRAQMRIAPHDSVERMTELGVEVRQTDARLRSRHEVDAVATGDVLRARHVVIATGSAPVVPEVPGLAAAGFLTNETVWRATRLPDALLVIGGGPIGCELGQAFQRLGSAVTIVNAAAHLLPREDADVAEVLERRLIAEGVTIVNAAQATGVERRGARKRVIIETPVGARAIDVDEILVAAGRRPRLQGLGLDEVGVTYDARGIHVDRAGRTSVAGIWAVGDVTATYRFTHWGAHQARLVVRNALLPGTAKDGRAWLPWTTFTQPEIARMGMSEDEARAQGLAYDVHRVPFEEVDRAICDGETDGFGKVLTKRGRGTILGAAIVHARAGELIAELTLAKRHGIALGALASMIHVYPTLGDVHGLVADHYLLGRLARWRPLLARWFAWRR
ncbi:MAG: FAD-dependent oxidoreductase [Candidatus Rokubacteria bacterium]|nr:FAD-dependent oxidoreductase [Candidatus Rokubacteria bacterium]